MNPSFINNYSCSKCFIINLLKQLRDKVSKSSYELCLFLQELNNKENINDSIEELTSKIANFIKDRNIFKVNNNLNFNEIKRDLKKIPIISKAPEILVVHINKIMFDENIRMNKTNVKFPEKLSLQTKHGVVDYSLESFIEHFGFYNFGHYISYRKFYNSWFSINDDYTNRISSRIAFSVSNPYMLFYKKL